MVDIAPRMGSCESQSWRRGSQTRWLAIAAEHPLQVIILVAFCWWTLPLIHSFSLPFPIIKGYYRFVLPVIIESTSPLLRQMQVHPWWVPSEVGTVVRQETSGVTTLVKSFSFWGEGLGRCVNDIKWRYPQDTQHQQSWLQQATKHVDVLRLLWDNYHFYLCLCLGLKFPTLYTYKKTSESWPWVAQAQSVALLGLSRQDACASIAGADHHDGGSRPAIAPLNVTATNHWMWTLHMNQIATMNHQGTTPWFLAW